MRVRLEVVGESSTEDIRSLVIAVHGLFPAGKSTLLEALRSGSTEQSEPAGLELVVDSAALLPNLVEVVQAWFARVAGSSERAIRITVDATTLEVRSSDTRNQMVERIAALVGDRHAANGDTIVIRAGENSVAAGVMTGSIHIHTDDRLAAARDYQQVEDRQPDPVRDEEDDDRTPLIRAKTVYWFGGPIDESAVRLDTSLMPITIYLSEERHHDQVEAAVNDLLTAAGLRIEQRDDPVIGSWFRRMRAGVAQTARSPITRETALTAAHAAEARFVLAQDATITATLMQNLPALIASLDKTKDAVIRVGAVLVVKVDWKLAIYQLTPAQQLLLNRQPELATSPENIARALGAQPVQVSEPPAVQ